MGWFGTTKYSSSAIGTKGFSSGIHSWEVTIDKLEPGRQWICIGVISKDKFTGSNDWNSQYGISTANQLYNTTGTSQPIEMNQKVELTLNMETGILTITGIGVQLP